jgi:hypothetical protein
VALGIPSTSGGALFILLKLSFQSTKPFIFGVCNCIDIYICMYVMYVCICLFEWNGFHFNAFLLVGSTQQFIIFVIFLNSFLLSLVAHLQCHTYRKFSTILAI